MNEKKDIVSFLQEEGYTPEQAGHEVILATMAYTDMLMDMAEKASGKEVDEYSTTFSDEEAEYALTVKRTKK